MTRARPLVSPQTAASGVSSGMICGPYSIEESEALVAATLLCLQQIYVNNICLMVFNLCPFSTGDIEKAYSFFCPHRPG